MEIEVVSKKENPLLNRTEVRFKVTHVKEKTPRRDAVIEKLAKMMNKNKECVIIDSMGSSFGVPETLGYAKIYKKREDAEKIERKHIIAREKRGQKGKKAEKKETPAAEEGAEAAEEAPAEEEPGDEKTGE